MSASSDRILLSQLKWPIETMYVGFRPTANTAASNTNQYRDWHRFAAAADNYIETTAEAGAYALEFNTNEAVFSNADNIYTSSRSNVEKITYPVYTQTIDTMKLEAHGIVIFDQYKRVFFNSYMPYNFGGQFIQTPEDEGAMMVNFCLYPGTYQPSGHINISRAREFYLNYASSYISTSNHADLVVVAIALNFLLITDGSAVLRYST